MAAGFSKHVSYYRTVNGKRVLVQGGAFPKQKITLAKPGSIAHKDGELLDRIHAHVAAKRPKTEHDLQEAVHDFVHGDEDRGFSGSPKELAKFQSDILSTLTKRGMVTHAQEDAETPLAAEKSKAATKGEMPSTASIVAARVERMIPIVKRLQANSSDKTLKQIAAGHMSDLAYIAETAAKSPEKIKPSDDLYKKLKRLEERIIGQTDKPSKPEHIGYSENAVNRYVKDRSAWSVSRMQRELAEAKSGKDTHRSRSDSLHTQANLMEAIRRRNAETPEEAKSKKAAHKTASAKREAGAQKKFDREWAAGKYHNYD